MTVESGYADMFGPQVPRTGDEGQTATFALASAAYRDNPVEDIKKADNEWHQSTVNAGRLALFKPNLGEAFGSRSAFLSTAVQDPSPRKADVYDA
ncbi:hypothetical protein SGLAM104S_03689 [Streptomyces glaucescens]